MKTTKITPVKYPSDLTGQAKDTEKIFSLAGAEAFYYSRRKENEKRIDRLSDQQ
jgi:hypothetical protein